MYKLFVPMILAFSVAACASGGETEISSSISSAAVTPNLDGRATPDAQVSSAALQPVRQVSSPRAIGPTSIVPQHASFSSRQQLPIPNANSVAVPATPAPRLSAIPTVPPLPADEPQLRDGPECNYVLEVANQEFQFAPETVALLRSSGARPWVFIRHDVDRGGKVLNPVVVRTAGIEEYDADAVRSLRGWQVTLPAGRSYLRGCMAKFAVR